MCGIIGVIGQDNVIQDVLSGLFALEYRGYDSAGIACMDRDIIYRMRRQGKVQRLVDDLQQVSLFSRVAIGHTRWATHGVPCERNSHPHMSLDKRIALVHNGIIENHIELRTQFEGVNFFSDTDTELLVVLISYYLQLGLTIKAAIRRTMGQLQGNYAFIVLDAKNPDKLFAACYGSPLLLGKMHNKLYIASDQLAFGALVNNFVCLENLDVAEISLSGNLIIEDQNSLSVQRQEHKRNVTNYLQDKGGYSHFMQKEIFEQVKAVESTLSGRIYKDHVLEQIFGKDAEKILFNTSHVVIIACGSSYYAGLIAKHWLESIAQIPCVVEIASEFRYKKRLILANTLLVIISQSGETADVLSALRDITNDPPGSYVGTLAICNVPQSTLVRNTDLVLLTHAGVEIGVAATKAFITQLAALAMLMLALGKYKQMSKVLIKQWIYDLSILPGMIDKYLSLDKEIQMLSHGFANTKNVLFLGRGELFPVALEGALKLKEISYIHAEAYPAGELKHGPLALVDNSVLIVFLVNDNHLLNKVKSNIQEVYSRGGRVIVVAPVSARIEPQDDLQILTVPVAPNNLVPILYTIPMQLLAYHVAVNRGNNVDQPRNLAKSVTVE